MKKSNRTLTIEEALEVFDKARHVSIRPKGCTLVLGFLPYHRAEGRRKKGETFAQMLCRVAALALDNQAADIRAPSLWDTCEACGASYSRKTEAGKICRRCEKGLKEIRRETKPDRSIKGVIG